MTGEEDLTFERERVSNEKRDVVMGEERERNEGGWRRRTGEDEEAEKMKKKGGFISIICFVFHFGVGWRNFYFFPPWSVWCYLAMLSLFIINFYINYIFSLFIN